MFNAFFALLIVIVTPVLTAVTFALQIVLALVVLFFHGIFGALRLLGRLFGVK